MATRRTFLKQSAAAAGLFALADATRAATADAPRAKAAPAHPARNSDRYEIEVPDTIDLTERCKIGLHGLAGQSDPHCYGQIWFGGALTCREPHLTHNASDATCTPKFAEAFPLLRSACGTEESRDIEQQQMDELVANISPDDGLYYAVWKPDRPWHSTYFNNKLVKEDFAWVGGVGRMMRAAMTWRQRDSDPKWDDLIRQMARGLGKIAICKDDYAYYPDGGHSIQFSYPKSGWQHTREPMGDRESKEGSVVDSIGHTAYALARWYRTSGDKEALELAGKITRFMMLPKMWGGLVEEISVNGREQGHFSPGHAHGRMVGLRGILEYGWAAQDERALEFVRRSYEHLRTFMIPRIGWLGPNGIGDSSIGMEGCCLGDLPALAIRMTDIGLADYWEDVDALGRNMLMEQQLTDIDQLRRVAEAGWAHHGGDDSTGRQTSDAMPDRIAGVFASGSLPNRVPTPGLAGCCSGNAAQGLYCVWEGALRWNGDTAQVNLLVNRASPVADVDSYLPYEGKVVVRNKSARRILIRIFSWIDRKQLRVSVSGQTRPMVWAGNHLLIDDLKPTDKIVLEFPVKETTASYTAHHRVWRKQRVYTYTFRASTVVDVSPKATSPRDIPLFQRDHMRQGPSPMKKVVRVVQNTPSLGW